MKKTIWIAIGIIFGLTLIGVGYTQITAYYAQVSLEDLYVKAGAVTSNVDNHGQKFYNPSTGANVYRRPINLANIALETGETIATSDADLELTNYSGKFLSDVTGATSTYAVTGKFADVISKKPAINVKAFGAIGDGSVDDYSAINDAFTQAQANNELVMFPAGTYRIDTKLSITTSDTGFFGVGEVIIDFRGTGDAIEVYSDTAIHNIVIENIKLKGNANCTNGFVFSGMVRSYVKNLRVYDVSNAAFNVKWGVLNNFTNLVCSSNDQAFSVTPTYGLYLDKQDAGEYTAGCTFINPMFEGVTTGIYIQDARNNSFFGGTSEANGTGLYINRTAGTYNARNLFNGVWFEANTVIDAYINEDHNSFISCRFASNGASPNVHMIGSVSESIYANSFMGCFIREMTLDPTSSDTSLKNCVFSDSLGLQSTGTRTIVNCITIDGNADYVSKYDNITYDAKTTFTPGIAFGGGTTGITYSKQVGYYVQSNDIIHFTAYIVLTSKGSDTGVCTITGFPQPSKFVTDLYQSTVVAEFNNITLATGTQIEMRMDAGQTSGALISSGSGVVSAIVTDTSMANDSSFIISGSYIMD